MSIEHILAEKGRNVVTIEPERTLSEAARLLDEKRIGAVVVGDANHPVLGIISVSDSKLFEGDQALARRRVMRRIWAIITHASALARVVSQSLASLRQRPSHAKVRSTTQRRGSTSKPEAMSERLTISRVQHPIFASAPFSFGPA